MNISCILFGHAEAVHRRGINQVDALVERGSYGGDGFVVVGSTPHPAAHCPGGRYSSRSRRVDQRRHHRKTSQGRDAYFESTISVALSKELAQAHAAAGQRFVAAPVFGRPEMAAAAKLFIVAAGDPATVDACRPLFDAMGQQMFPIGTEPSAANLVKLSGNFLLASAIEALGEAIALVGKAGIDRHAFVDLLTSTIFPAPAYKTYGGLIADNKFQPAKFAAPLGFKDIRLALAAAESLRVPMPLGSLLHDRFLRLLAQGGDNLDWAAIGGLAAQDSNAG